MGLPWFLCPTIESLMFLYVLRLYGVDQEAEPDQQAQRIVFGGLKTVGSCMICMLETES